MKLRLTLLSLTGLLFGSISLQAQAVTQDVTKVQQGMHNYVTQDMELYDLAGVKLDHNGSAIFKAAKLRWADFNDDGLDDFVMLSGDSHEYFKIRSAENTNLCINLTGYIPNDPNGRNFYAGIRLKQCGEGGVLWKYDASTGKLLNAKKDDAGNLKCLDVAGKDYVNGRDLLGWYCQNAPQQKWNFYADGTIRSRGNDNFSVDAAKPIHQRNLIIWSTHKGSNQRWHRDYGNMKTRVFLNAGRQANGSIAFNQVREFEGVYELPFWGDFTGDGKQELFLSAAPTKDTSASNTSLDNINYLQYSSKKIVGVGDFSGDSKADLLFIENKQLNMLRVEGVRLGELRGREIAIPWLANQPSIDKMADILVGDFDNNNVADIVLQNNNIPDAQSLQLLLNNRSGTAFTAYNVKAMVNNTHYKAIVNNGDVTRMHVGKLDGQDSLIRQEGGGWSHDNFRTLEALRLNYTVDNATEKTAYFTYRPINSKVISGQSIQYQTKFGAGAYLSFGDMNGDGQFDVIRSEHQGTEGWARDSFGSLSAFTHTQWDEDFSIKKSGRLQSNVSIYSQNIAGTQAFSAGNLSGTNYFIWYDTLGTLKYKLRQAGSSQWDGALTLLRGGENLNSAARLGIKTVVIDEYLYSFRFDETNKVLIDRWNIDRNQQVLELAHAKVFNEFSTNPGKTDPEETIVLNLDSSYAQTPAKMSIFALQSAYSRSAKLQFVYAQSASAIVNRSIQLNLDGSIPDVFDVFERKAPKVSSITKQMYITGQGINRAQGQDFLGATVAEQKGDIELTANAKTATNKTTARVNTSVKLILAMNNAVYQLNVTAGGDLHRYKHASVPYNGDYLGLLHDQHSKWGVVVVSKNANNHGVDVLRPEELSIHLDRDKLGITNQTTNGFLPSAKTSKSQFCNQMILLLNHKPYAFNIDCRAVRLERYGSKVAVESILGYIEGPPPFPAENLIDQSTGSNLTNYTTLELEETSGRELQLTQGASKGHIRENHGHATAVGVLGGYWDNTSEARDVKEFKDIFARTTTDKQTLAPRDEDCAVYNLRMKNGIMDTYADRYRRLRDLDDNPIPNDSGYNHLCFRNKGSLVVKARTIDIYGLVDKRDGTVYGTIPKPLEGSDSVQQLDFAIKYDYLRVGSLDGKIGFLDLKGRKHYGDGPIRPNIKNPNFNVNFESYRGLDANLKDYEKSIRQAIVARNTLFKEVYPNAEIDKIKNGGVVHTDNYDHLGDRGKDLYPPSRARSLGYMVAQNGGQGGLAVKNYGLGSLGRVASLVDFDLALPQKYGYQYNDGAATESKVWIKTSSQDSIIFEGEGHFKDGWAVRISASAGVSFIAEASAEVLSASNNYGGGDTWTYKADSTTINENTRELRVLNYPRPYATIKSAQNRPKLSSICLGLVKSYGYNAYYFPGSIDNYTHLLNNVFDYDNILDVKEIPKTATPWRITYGVTGVTRLDPNTEATLCSDL